MAIKRNNGDIKPEAQLLISPESYNDCLDASERLETDILNTDVFFWYFGFGRNKQFWKWDFFQLL